MTDKIDDKDFPNHRFDGAKEVPSITSDRSALPAPYDGLVERLDSHMGLADMGKVLEDCRLAASSLHIKGERP